MQEYLDYFRDLLNSTREKINVVCACANRDD